MTINIDELISKVRQIAKERPDVVYADKIFRDERGCEYDGGACSDGSIGCIFGQAGIRDPQQANIWAILNRFTFADEYPGTGKVGWCQTVQCAQDRGETWAEAIRLADERFPLSVES